MVQGKGVAYGGVSHKGGYHIYLQSTAGSETTVGGFQGAWLGEGLKVEGRGGKVQGRGGEVRFTPGGILRFTAGGVQSAGRGGGGGSTFQGRGGCAVQGLQCRI